MPDDTQVIACFGDSITDGTGSTLNGDDRWPDILSRRPGAPTIALRGGERRHRRQSNHQPDAVRSDDPFAGGPSALDRLERDVLVTVRLSTVIWLEGINDLSSGASADTVIAGIKEGVRRIRAHGSRILMATITPVLVPTAAAGTADVDAHRQAVNTFIRTSDLFDDVIDFDAVTRDPSTGGLRPEFHPNSSIGGPGDGLHPNRAAISRWGMRWS